MDLYAVVIYFLAGICWIYTWRALVGYDWLRQMPLLWIAFKTVPFTYSLFILSAAMIIFLYETRHSVEKK